MIWAIKLSAFRYFIEHLPGEKNVWADILIRWAVTTKSSIHIKQNVRAKSLVEAPISPVMDSKFDWTALKDMILSYNDAKESTPSSFKNRENGWVNKEGASWIQYSANLLKLWIIIAAHTGYGGHRSWRFTHASIKPHFWWAKQADDVKVFVTSCLHYVARAVGTVKPRPFGHALQESKPNKLLHFDFCHMEKSDKGNTYFLTLKDDFHGFVWLAPTNETAAEVTADTLISWFASFGIVTVWV